jgi:hypothetical protein
MSEKRSVARLTQSVEMHDVELEGQGYCVTGLKENMSA